MSNRPHIAAALGFGFCKENVCKKQTSPWPFRAELNGFPSWTGKCLLTLDAPRPARSLGIAVGCVSEGKSPESPWQDRLRRQMGTQRSLEGRRRVSEGRRSGTGAPVSLLVAVRGPATGVMSLSLRMTPQNYPPICLLLETSGKQNPGRAAALLLGWSVSDFMV